MQKNTLFKIAFSYFIIFFFSFTVYAINVADENWTVDIQEQKYNLIIFCILAFIGVILISIGAAADRNKSRVINKKAIYGGLSIAVLFLVWRLLMALF